jgi:thioredoxin reductase
MAAELKLVQPHVKVTLIHSRGRLLSAEGLPDDCKDRALELILESGVEVLLNHRVSETREIESGNARPKSFEIKFSNGEAMIASEVVMAVSRSVPSSTYLPSEALDVDGYIKIHPKCVSPSCQFFVTSLILHHNHNSIVRTLTP